MVLLPVIVTTKSENTLSRSKNYNKILLLIVGLIKNVNDDYQVISTYVKLEDTNLKEKKILLII